MTAGSGEKVRHTSEIVGGALLAVFFAGAFYLSTGFDRQDAVFPLAVSGLGFVLASLYALQSAVMGSRAATPVAASPVENEVDPSDDLDYVFSTATRREWWTTLAFFGSFFLSLFLLGIYVTSLVFPAVYLRLQDGRSWKFSIAYAAVLTAVVHAVFALALSQRLPAGVLTGF